MSLPSLKKMWILINNLRECSKTEVKKIIKEVLQVKENTAKRYYRALKKFGIIFEEGDTIKILRTFKNQIDFYRYMATQILESTGIDIFEVINNISQKQISITPEIVLLKVIRTHKQVSLSSLRDLFIALKYAGFLVKRYTYTRFEIKDVESAVKAVIMERGSVKYGQLKRVLMKRYSFEERDITRAIINLAKAKEITVVGENIIEFITKAEPFIGEEIVEGRYGIGTLPEDLFKELIYLSGAKPQLIEYVQTPEGEFMEIRSVIGNRAYITLSAV